MAEEVVRKSYTLRSQPISKVGIARITHLTGNSFSDPMSDARTVALSKTCVWRCQERFAAEGFYGLLRDKTRRSRIPKLDPSIAGRIVALTMETPPGQTTRWTGAAMAGAAGVSVSSVQRIWRAHGLQPHRIRQFKLSKDPEFVDKLRDVVGLYAVILSVDEKSQIQALDRTSRAADEEGPRPER